MGISRYPAVGGGTYWASMGAPAGGNVKGSYVQLTASTSEALRGIFVMIPIANNGALWVLVDIATGGAGSETVVIANIPFGSPNGNVTLNQVGVFIPVNIASGVRLSCRMQSNNSLSTNTVDIAVLAVGGTSSAVPITYGVSTATSTGASVDPGAVANTKGSYAQLTASTSADCDWLIVLAQSGNNNPTTGSFALDIATGGAGSETVVVPDLGFMTHNSFDSLGPVAFSVPVTIPSGTRLSARMASNITDATDRVIQVGVIAVTNSGMNGGGSGAAANGYAFFG